MQATSRTTPARFTATARTLLFALTLVGPSSWTAAAQSELGPEEREILDFDRRHGANRSTLETLDQILEETPDDHACRALRARSRFHAGDYPGAVEDARAALDGARNGGLSGEDAAACARIWLLVLTELGREEEALAAVEPLPTTTQPTGGKPADLLHPERDPRDAWALARALKEAGRRDEATARWQQGAEAKATTWDELLDRARCQRALGFVERAAQTLVSADKVASDGSGVEPDVLVELAETYFEFYGEVDDPVSRAHSPADLCREALEKAKDHEEARLLLFRLHRFNWQRTSQAPSEILEALLVERPASIRAQVARASSAIDDGDLVTARDALAQLAKLAPARRDVRSERAALAWVEHREDEARGLLEELLAEDPRDSAPELAVGWHLLELYRFAESLPFLEKAVERNSRDWVAWLQLGRAQANVGDESKARESLNHAVQVGEGRRDAWRDNTLLVLKRMAETMVTKDLGDLRFVWRPDEAAVLETYYAPFYSRAREELAARYGFTPGPVQIEVFRAWEDFSVRSTGFQGYPALGVCFGPVVTAVSPLCQLRGTFSWARTSYHEFTHVVHLGLSHNRCPRWITEGLATWEEGAKRASWWRNMRRDLLDARANEAILPVRRLNNAFRGPRVLFAYYQSGLLCRMLIERHGFPPMVRLLEAFDRGADLDGALREVFGKSPEELDSEFLAFVDDVLKGLAIEPRWSREKTFELRFRLSRMPPDEPAARPAWADEWCRVAWGSYLQGKTVDAQEALRLAELAGDLPPRGEFLRGELLLDQRDEDGAAGAFRAGLERGGEDYRARMALGSLLVHKGKLEEAEHEFTAAEHAFPGFDDPHFCAELELARLFERSGKDTEANEARLRWLDWNAGDYATRVKVAEWLDRETRHEESVRLWEEANDVDPFRRHLHYAWGLALRALGRHEEARREFRTGLAVSFELDGDVQLGSTEGLTRDEVLELTGLDPEELEKLTPEELQERLRATSQDDPNHESGGLYGKRFRDEEPLLWANVALEELELGNRDEARAAVDRALALDPGCAPALEARKQLE